VNKSELVDQIAAATDLPKNTTAKVLDALINAVTQTLASGEEVSLVGFGSFLVKVRPARTGRNPKTGEALQIKASKVPGFRAGKALKDAVNH
jgi:DNA-binding protein HU-beta